MSSRSGKRARPPTKGESLSDNERKKSTRSRLDDEVFVGNGGDETGYFSSGSDEGAASLQRGASSAATAEELETADERRLRLAQGYLKKLAEATRIGSRGDDGDAEGEEEGDSEGEGDAPSARADLRQSRSASSAAALSDEAVHSAVAQQLRDEALAAQGVLYREMSSVLARSALRCSFQEGHSQPPTCVAVAGDGMTAYTGGKDCTLIRWDRRGAQGRANGSGSSNSSVASAAASGPMAWTQMLYPGRRRTRADKASQEERGRTRPVMVAGYGGGRIGSTSSSGGGAAAAAAAAAAAVDGGLQDDLEGADGALSAAASALTPKILHADGASSIVVPVLSKAATAALRAGGDGAILAAAAANADAMASLRQVPDYGIDGHTSDVLAVALSADGAFLVSAGRDRFVRVWDPHAPVNLENFVGHKDAVTALAFRSSAPGALTAGRGCSHTLYSASADRSVKLWSLDEMAYLETLFGHQAEVCGLSSAPGAKDRCVTVGRDRSARMWKIPEQTQLVFRGHASDVNEESVAMVGDSWFVTGAHDGSLSLWHVSKKKPVATVHAAHGDGSASASSGAAVDAVAAATGCAADALSGGYCASITALAYLPNSDVLASGSGDGFIRLWALEDAAAAAAGGAHKRGGASTFKGLRQVAAVPVRGIVNGLAFAADGSVLVAAVGQEHRMGRWWHYANARNGLATIALPTTD